jgi:hypothetical protein
VPASAFAIGKFAALAAVPLALRRGAKPERLTQGVE